MLRKISRILLLCCVLAVISLGTALAAVPAGSLFAVPKTGIDGVERWGYMNESGKVVIDCIYSAAEPFDVSGVAAVYDAAGQAALIDAKGNILTGWQPAPQEIAYENGIAAFRYPDRTAFFTASGSRIGEYPGAVGFPANERVCVRTGEGENARYGYVDLAGVSVIAPVYRNAGQFADGRALVCDQQGNWQLIAPDGREQASLPAGTEPVEPVIYHNSVVILKNHVDKYALYSVKEKRFVTTYAYDEILPFHDQRAMARMGTDWGLLSTVGIEIVKPAYPYMSYMGDGLYAVRGVDTGASVIDGLGQEIYRTDTYAGGFQTFRYGISWHGTPEGGVVFFNASGSLKKTVSGIESPDIVASTVAKVYKDGRIQYINIYNGRTLYDNVREYDLDGGIHVETETYEKYLGMQEDGTEYGWKIEYPRLSGMQDETVQTRINDTIRAFFTAGPSGQSGRIALTATYGLSVEGNVLVVWANGVSDMGEAATIWDSSIGLDLRTGTKYTAERDLFNDKMLSVTGRLLPQSAPYYTSPRMDRNGVTFFRDYPATGTALPYTESVHLTFDQLAEAINFDGVCYRALTGFTGTVYPDVPYNHWAFGYVAEVSSRGLMHGDDTGFRPDSPILTSEVCAAVARVLELPDGVLPGLSTDKWYAAEVGAVYEAGLLSGFDIYWFDPDVVMTRADAMQLLANVLEHRNRAGKEMTADEVMTHLARFPDAAHIPEDRRRAAAVCVRSGLVQGDENGLRPSDAFTRAEFAKILLSIAEK